MSRTIAIITFKDMPDRKFKIKKAYPGTCSDKRDHTVCAFFDVNCNRTTHGDMCLKASIFFKEIKHAK